MPKRIESLFRNLFRKRAVEQALDDELRSSVEVLTQEKMKQGLSQMVARREALIELGGIEQVKEEVRAIRAGRLLEDFARDVRFAFRALARSPGFTAVAVLTLALGIGGVTAVFTVVNSLLLRPLPYPEAGRLMMLYERWSQSKPRMSVSYPNFLDWREMNHTFAGLAAFRESQFTVTDGEPETVWGDRASAELFSTLGVSPALGRIFVPEEDKPGGSPVVILSGEFWRRRFGGDPAVVGKTIALDKRIHTVIGILPLGFRLLDPVDVFVPLGQWEERILRSRELHAAIHVIGRLKPGVTAPQARSDMERVARTLADQYPGANARHGITIVPLGEAMAGLLTAIGPVLMLMLAAVGLVLLVACANVANLFLVRATAREREFAIRAALGARWIDIARHLLAESLLVALAGGLLGLLLARWGLPLLLALAPSYTLALGSIELEKRVLGLALALSILTGLFFGLLPALRGRRWNVLDSLRGDVVGRRSLTHECIVGGEVALTVMLLVGAGLMIRSISRLWRIRAGFNLRGVVGVAIDPSPAMLDNPAKLRVAYRGVVERAALLPEVESAAMTCCVPLDGSRNQIPFSLGLSAPPLEQMHEAVWFITTPDFLQVMGIPLIKGRYFTWQDAEQSPLVVVVDEVLANGLFPHEDPLGKQLTLATLGQAEIVGVVGHVKHWGLDADDSARVRYQIYTPVLQAPAPLLKAPGTWIVVFRTARRPAALASGVRGQIAEAGTGLRVSRVQTVEQMIWESMAPRRFAMCLLVVFAVLALSLASVGVYGVVSRSVAARTHEIGIRMALGADRSDIARMVVARNMGLTLIGAAAGLVGSLGLTRAMSALLYAVTPTDPATLLTAAAVLAGVAGLASYFPARRAARLEPNDALRYE